MIDKTEKPKIPSKFAKHASRYNEFGFNISKTRQDNILFGVLYNPMYIDFIQII